MPTLENSVRDAMVNAAVDTIDAGSTNANGVLELYTASYGTLLVTLPFANPAFGNSSSGSATGTINSAQAVASGDAESYRVKDRDGTVRWSSSAANAVSPSGGGGEVVLSQVNTTISSGQTVSVSACTFTVPAS